MFVRGGGTHLIRKGQSMNKAELIKALAELLAEKMEIGEEPTNGEMIQALFPKIELGEIVYNTRRYFLMGEAIDTFDFNTTDKWWNAPYKKDGE